MPTMIATKHVHSQDDDAAEGGRALKRTAGSSSTRISGYEVHSADGSSIGATTSIDGSLRGANGARRRLPCCSPSCENFCGSISSTSCRSSSR